MSEPEDPPVTPTRLSGIITPLAAAWPARTWTPAERVTAGMMNGMRDQLNELYARTTSIQTWLPTDASGAGLIFSTTQKCRYTVDGKIVHFWGHILFPSTAATQQVQIGGLPFPNGDVYAGAHLTYGQTANFASLHFPIGQSVLYGYGQTGGVITWAMLSGQQIIFQGNYLKA